MLEVAVMATELKGHEVETGDAQSAPPKPEAHAQYEELLG